jgi:hypothetical protein
MTDHEKLRNKIAVLSDQDSKVFCCSLLLSGFLRLMNRYPEAKTIVIIAITATTRTIGNCAMLNQTVFSPELPNWSVAKSVKL